MLTHPARKHERGQVLPLLALALIALAGFAALAVDGGNLYTEQRRAQAAADNAVMAAAYQQMKGFSGANLSNAAFANASQNGYTNGAHTQVVFHLPPVHGAYAGNSQYMEVVITQTVPTALAHLVYRQDPIPLTVIAVAHGTPTGPVMAGYAIAAMDPDHNCNGTIFMEADGGGNQGGTFLTDGGAFVNSTCNPALVTDGNHDGIQTDGPPIDVVGGSNGGSVCTAPGVPDHCNWYPAPTTGFNGGTSLPQDPLQGSPADTLPPCAGPNRTLTTEFSSGDGHTIHPGTYASLDASSPSRAMTLLPGIYCVTGGQVSSGNQDTTGIGVLLYLTGTATIKFSGSGNLNLQAPTTASSGCLGTDDTSSTICPYLGIVIYKVNGSNVCGNSAVDIDFTGGASMNVVGLIFAPYSTVKYGGGGSLTMVGQTIAGCVKFNGNGNINIIYNPNLTYSPPPTVRLDQ